MSTRTDRGAAPEPRWLSVPEQAAWRAYLSATLQVSEAVERHLRSAGVPHAYYEILVRLSEAPTRALRMSELAEASANSRSRLSHAADRLEELGWVRRVECPTDKRGQVAELTDAGFDALRGLAPGHVESVREALFDALTPAQVKQLQTICEAIMQHAADLGRPPLGPAPTMEA